MNDDGSMDEAEVEGLVIFPEFSETLSAVFDPDPDSPGPPYVHRVRPPALPEREYPEGYWESVGEVVEEWRVEGNDG